MKGFRSRTKGNSNFGSDRVTYFFDDFIGDALLANWGNPVNASIATDDANALLEFDTTGADTTSGVSMSSYDHWDPGLGCGIEFRYRIETRADTSHFLGFFNGTNKIRFVIDSTDSNIDLEADGGSASAVDVDTGVDVDGNFHIYKIETTSTGIVKAYIDGQLVHQTAENVVAVDGSQASYIRFLVDDAAATQGVSQLDYVKAWQNRT